MESYERHLPLCNYEILTSESDAETEESSTTNEADELKTHTEAKNLTPAETNSSFVPASPAKESTLQCLAKLIPPSPEKPKKEVQARTVAR